MISLAFGNADRFMDIVRREIGLAKLPAAGQLDLDIGDHGQLEAAFADAVAGNVAALLLGHIQEVQVVAGNIDALHVDWRAKAQHGATRGTEILGRLSAHNIEHWRIGPALAEYRARLKLLEFAYEADRHEQVRVADHLVNQPLKLLLVLWRI